MRAFVIAPTAGGPLSCPAPLNRAFPSRLGPFPLRLWIMIQALRTQLGSYVVKILFALLVGSFAIFGIGDVVRGLISAERPAVIAGDQEISSVEISRAFQAQVNQLRQRFGGRFTTEQAVQLGMLDQTVERLVADSLFDQEARRLGLEVGMEMVREKMRDEPAFKDSTGVFSARAFETALRNASLSEQDFVRLVRQDVDRQLLVGAIEAGATPPKAILVTLERYRGERRVAEMVALRHAAMTGLPEPTAEELTKYHQDNGARFSAPEYRRALMLRLSAEDLAANVQIDDAAIKEEYEHRSADYQTPERRDILQALVQEEADATRLVEAAKAGDFAAAAKDIAKIEGDALKLSGVARAELPPELADPVFAAAEGGVTAPVKSTLGWHVFKVEKIEPATVRTLDEVRDEVRKLLAQDRAIDQLARVSVQLEDELMGGGTIQESAEKLKLKTVEIGPVDRSGNGVDGRTVELPTADRAALLKTLFETESGKTSALTETEKDEFFAVRVDEVRPETLRPLAEVKEQVTEAIMAERRAAAAKAKGADLLAKVKAGGDLIKLAEGEGIAVEATPAVTRNGRVAGSPGAPVLSAMFQMKPGDVAQATLPDTEIVVRLKEILPAEIVESESAQLTQQVRAAVAEDLAQSYSQALRQRYAVEIDRSQIDRMR